MRGKKQIMRWNASFYGSISNDGKEDGACVGVWALVKNDFLAFFQHSQKFTCN